MDAGFKVRRARRESEASHKSEFLKSSPQKIRWTAEKHLGYVESTLRDAEGSHVVILNANVCTRLHGRIWYGDLDLTTHEEAVKALSKELGEDVYVLFEGDARRKNEQPALEKAAYTTFGEFREFYRRDRRGVLKNI